MRFRVGVINGVDVLTGIQEGAGKKILSNSSHTPMAKGRRGTTDHS